MKIVRVPVVTQQKRIQLGTTRLRVWSLASLSGLRIWCCRELWSRSQTWLRSGIAVALAGSNSSDLTLACWTSICHRCGPKKTKEDKKEKENRANKTFGDIAKAVLTEKFVALNAYTEKEENSRISNLIPTQETRNKTQNKPQRSRRKEIMRYKPMKLKIEKINETKSWFFREINTINKCLTRLIRKKRQITSIKIKYQLSLDLADFKKIIREYYEQLCTCKFDNLAEMGHFLQKYRLPQPTQYGIDNLSIPTSVRKWICSYKFPQKTYSDPNGFTGEFSHLKK